jgi:hypothetical protein
MKNKGRDTRMELHRAILRIEHGRPKRIGKDRCRMNISIVAREAGVTPACVHNNYPDVAEVIRKKVGKTRRSQRDLQGGELKRLLDSVRLLRQRLRTAERDVMRIASENARLVSENTVLKAQLHARNVVSLRRRQGAAGGWTDIAEPVRHK